MVNILDSQRREIESFWYFRIVMVPEKIIFGELNVLFYTREPQLQNSQRIYCIGKSWISSLTIVENKIMTKFDDSENDPCVYKIWCLNFNFAKNQKLGQHRIAGWVLADF